VAMERACTIIQGPPGTGKTHVSVQVLRLWAKCLGGTPLLAVSDSNIAVDNIAAGLQRAGVRVVRLGRPEKIRGQNLEDITLEAQVSQLKEKRAQERAQEMGADVVEPDKGKGAGKGSGKGGLDLEADHESKRHNKFQDFKLQMEIIQKAEVVCTTTISAGSEFLSRLSFAGILIDEVAQATELSAIVPIVLRGGSSLRRLALVGDHCQLPPSIQSSEAENRGLSLSIYSRLQKSSVQPFMLDTQYRSHAKIMEFSSDAFYAGALGCGIDAAARPLPRGVPWPNVSVPVAYVEVGSPEESEGDSKFNTGEASRLLEFVRGVLRAGDLGIGDIGVVTPYTAQVRRLRQLLRPLIPHGADPRILEIGSVDAYQGREKELIVFSAVRCNAGGKVGFLGDWRRLNVMLTRARQDARELPQGWFATG